MIPSISNFEEIVSPFKAVLLDAYGVFWAGGSMGLFPGSKEMMKSLVESGKKVGVLSNTTQLSVKEVAKVKSHGLILGEHFHFFLTSGEIAKEAFSKSHLPFPAEKKKFWVFGKKHPRFSSHEPLFESSLYEETFHLPEADFIYISIPHLNGEDQEDPFVFQKEVNEIKAYGIPVICVNPDKFAHEGTPLKAVVRQGSIAELFKETGSEVFYMGKPEPVAYQAAMRHFLAEDFILPHEVLMVGDTPEIDIRGAKKASMASALVTQTGIMGERVDRYGLEAAFESCMPGDRPDFLIKRFAK